MTDIQPTCKHSCQFQVQGVFYLDCLKSRSSQAYGCIICHLCFIDGETEAQRG